MVPLSLPVYCQKQLSSIRTMSLSPPAVWTNQILEFVISDIFMESIDGLESTDSKGTSVRNFPDACDP